MARGNITIRTPLTDAYSKKRIVASGVAGSINAGEPTKQGTAGAVAIMVDGDGTTSQRFTGIAKSDSTDTVAAAGEVYVISPFPGIDYACKAKSAAAADTQAEIDALVGKRVVFDLTGTTWSIDTAAADSTSSGICIYGGDYRTSTIYFQISNSITLFGNVTT
jgi:hypothetical protein